MPSLTMMPDTKIFNWIDSCVASYFVRHRLKNDKRANKLPVSMRKLAWDGLVTDSVRFTY